MRNLLFTLLCFLPICAISQADTTWTHLYGGVGNDNCEDMILTQDSGLMIIGSTSSFGLDNSQMYFLKLDSIGNVEWSKTFGGQGIEWGTSVIQTSDKGYIGAGYTSSFGSGGYDGYIIKIDSVGNFKWQMVHGHEDWDFINDITAYSSNEYILTGKSHSLTTNSMEGWIFKITDGNSSPDWEQFYTGDEEDLFKAAVANSNGIIMTVGSTASTGEGGNDALICRYDDTGNLISSKLYGDSLNDIFNDIIAQPDDEFVLTGKIEDTLTGEGDPVIIRIDTNGDEKWKGRWFYGSNVLNGEGNKVIQYNNETKYAVVGTTTLPFSQTDFFFVVTETNQGTYLYGTTHGKTKAETASGLVRGHNDRIFMAGTTSSYDATFTDIVLYQTDTLGLLQDNSLYSNIDDLNVVLNTEKAPILKELKWNVSESQLNLLLDEDESLNNASISVYNTIGQQLITKTINSSQISIDLNAYSKGVYFFVVTKSNQIVSREKFIKP